MGTGPERAAAIVQALFPGGGDPFVGADLTRTVEPGDIELRIGASSADVRGTARIRLTGPTLVLDHTRPRHCRVITEVR